MPSLKSLLFVLNGQFVVFQCVVLVSSKYTIITILNTIISECKMVKNEWVVSHISLNCDMPEDQPSVTFPYKAQIKGTAWHDTLHFPLVCLQSHCFVLCFCMIIVLRRDCIS